MPQLIGGAAITMQRLLSSELASKYNFIPLYQNRPAGGLNLKLVLEMAKEIKIHRPDLIHIRGLQNEGFHGALAARLAGCKRIVISVHGSNSDLLHASKIKIALFKYLIEPFTLLLSIYFYCVCYAQAKKFSHYKNYYGVIHNSAPASSEVSNRKKTRGGLGLTESDIACIYIGRLTDEKGLLILANAISKLGHAEIYSNLKFLIIGDGPLYQDFVNQFEEEITAGKVCMLGRREDVQDILHAGDLFVFPTLHENLSLALLEACTAGIAILATNVGGNPEVIRDGVDGLLVPPGDAKALQSGIERLAGNPELRRTLGHSAKQRAIESFSQSKLLKEIELFYDRVLMR